jgi:hypothetical protein
VSGSTARSSRSQRWRKASRAWLEAEHRGLKDTRYTSGAVPTLLAQITPSTDSGQVGGSQQHRNDALFQAWVVLSIPVPWGQLVWGTGREGGEEGEEGWGGPPWLERC